MEAPATTPMWPARSDSDARDAGAGSEHGVIAVARAKLGMRLTSHHDAALAPVPVPGNLLPGQAQAAVSIRLT